MRRGEVGILPNPLIGRGENGRVSLRWTVSWTFGEGEAASGGMQARAWVKGEPGPCGADDPIPYGAAALPELRAGGRASPHAPSAAYRHR